MAYSRKRAILMLGALLSCVILVAAAVLFVDRPASTWSHEHLRRPAVFDRLTRYVDPLPTAATLGIAGVGLAAAFAGWRPGERGRTLISVCLAILVSEAIKEQLKILFGRPWPQSWTSGTPSWIGNHAYGFQPLHGGSGWESFPSGHTAQVAAIAAVIWLRLPRIRWLGVAMALAVAFALWASNYHFVGDILAGALLGTLCGIGVVAVVCRPTPVRVEYREMRRPASKPH